MTQEEMLRDYIECVSRKLTQDFRQIERCANLLTESEAWSRPNERCNSVANLVLHLTGNINQWIVSGIGGADSERNRPAEFTARGPAPVAPIVAAFASTIDAAVKILRSMTSTNLSHEYSIQGYEVTGLVAVFHVAEHLSFHTGQIVHITKAIRNVDLSLYDAQGQTTTSATRRPW